MPPQADVPDDQDRDDHDCEADGHRWEVARLPFLQRILSATTAFAVECSACGERRGVEAGARATEVSGPKPAPEDEPMHDPKVQSDIKAAIKEALEEAIEETIASAVGDDEPDDDCGCEEDEGDAEDDAYDCAGPEDVDAMRALAESPAVQLDRHAERVFELLTLEDDRIADAEKRVAVYLDAVERLHGLFNPPPLHEVTFGGATGEVPLPPTPPPPYQPGTGPFHPGVTTS